MQQMPDLQQKHPLWVKAVLLALALAAIAGLASLGEWQLRRRAWKHELVARVQERIHADPRSAPGPEAWASVNERDDAYRHVSLRGIFLNDKETLVETATVLGAGYWVLTPLRTGTGFIVIVNRGFVPAAARRAFGHVSGETEITGLMRMSEPLGRFLRANRPESGLWYSRDTMAIAAKYGLQQAAPYFVDEDAMTQGWPRGGMTVVDFPDNHLVYALTWFGLALLLGAGTAYVVSGAGKTQTWK